MKNKYLSILFNFISTLILFDKTRINIIIKK